MKCFYHSADLDGHCSGALIKMLYPEIELIGINYGDQFPWESIKNETVYMVDFSLQPFDYMIRLRDMCDLIWIDHHISAIEEAKKDNSNWLDPPNYIYSGIGACRLVFDSFYRGLVREVPLFVKLLSEYDVWDHSDYRTLPFQYGMRLENDTNPNNQDFWISLFQSTIVERIITNGETILRYVKLDNSKYASTCKFDTKLDGLRCIAINKGMANSQLFDSVWDPTMYDAMLSFIWRNKQWTVSLYSNKEDIDVSIVAKKRGGGGHKGAAGFQCRELPFELK